MSNLVGIHICAVILPCVPAGLLHVLVSFVDWFVVFDPLDVKFGLFLGLVGRNTREGYEIWRNVGLGIAVAGIRGVAGLGGRTRACGWDWGL